MPCPDLVILDLSLPKKTGREVFMRIRGSSKCPGVPVIVLTSSDARKDREEIAAVGTHTYIRKPSRLTEFIALGRLFKEMIGSCPK
jgi:DNA-binding response OmpR family regulator